MWNGLRHDAFHYLLDHALLGGAALRVGIVRFDFVAQVPVAQQAHFGREKTLALRIDEVVHPDVVLRDVLSGLCLCLRDCQVDVGWDALVETLREADFGPLPACPGGTVFQAFVERGEGEVQQDREGQFVVEEVIEDMRGRIVTGEYFVERKHRAEIEIGLLIELAIDLVHVAIELFEQALEAVEHGIERGLIAGEVGADEVFEHCRIAVVCTPELGYLTETTFDAKFLLGAILGGQFALQLGDRVIHPRGSNCGRCLSGSGSVLHENLLRTKWNRDAQGGCRQQRQTKAVFHFLLLFISISCSLGPTPVVDRARNY